MFSSFKDEVDRAKRELVSKDRELANKDRELANKDQELDRAKCELAQLRALVQGRPIQTKPEIVSQFRVTDIAHVPWR
jgi:hypothetical protein